MVLANGDIVKTASRARKSAAGFVLFLSVYLLINFTYNFPPSVCFARGQVSIIKIQREKYLVNSINYQQ